MQYRPAERLTHAGTGGPLVDYGLAPYSVCQFQGGLVLYQPRMTLTHPDRAETQPRLSLGSAGEGHSFPGLVLQRGVVVESRRGTAGARQTAAAQMAFAAQRVHRTDCREQTDGWPLRRGEARSGPPFCASCAPQWHSLPLPPRLPLRPFSSSGSTALLQRPGAASRPSW